MSEQRKEFTGVWIPRQVLEDKDLSPAEKILFADISSFNKCFKLNSTFAEQFGVSVPTIQRWLRNLKERGFVIDVGFDGRKRYLQGYHICNPRGITDDMAGVSNVKPIDNSIDTNILSETSVSQSEPIRIVEDTPPKKKKTSDIPQQVYDVFNEVLGKAPRNWTINKTQRQCAENLYAERGLNQIRKALENYVQYRKEPFCPQINSPYDLDSKWSQLYEFIKKQD